MTTSIDKNLADLASEFQEWSRQLLACDPSVDEETLIDFIDIQTWGEEIDASARRLGFTWELLEETASTLYGNY